VDRFRVERVAAAGHHFILTSAWRARASMSIPA
jgi:hypothetical protein